MNASLTPVMLQKAPGIPSPTQQGIGAPVERKEDRRLLLGRGQFVGDMKMPDMLEVAFVRSPLAHARLAGITKPHGLEAMVFTMADLKGVKPIIAASALPGFQVSEQPPLAMDKVRYVGELVAACIAPTRAMAEDFCLQVEVDYRELPVQAEMYAAMQSSALVHEH